jgi:hypothetical protein
MVATLDISRGYPTLSRIHSTKLIISYNLYWLYHYISGIQRGIFEKYFLSIHDGEAPSAEVELPGTHAANSRKQQRYNQQNVLQFGIGTRLEFLFTNNMHTHTQSHTHIYIYIKLYIYVCVIPSSSDICIW